MTAAAKEWLRVARDQIGRLDKVLPELERMAEARDLLVEKLEGEAEHLRWKVEVYKSAAREVVRDCHGCGRSYLVKLLLPLKPDHVEWKAGRFARWLCGDCRVLEGKTIPPPVLAYAYAQSSSTGRTGGSVNQPIAKAWPGDPILLVRPVTLSSYKRAIVKLAEFLVPEVRIERGTLVALQVERGSALVTIRIPVPNEPTETAPVAALGGAECWDGEV